MIAPSRAETLMGRAFRDVFDRETFYALLRRSPDWRRVEAMVRCVHSPLGAYRFHVSLARRGAGLPPKGDEIVVQYEMTPQEFGLANEERFAEVGRAMAEKANREVENTYMLIDEDG